MSDPVEDFVTTFAGSRAQQVHEALAHVRDRQREAGISVAELAWEVKLRDHWQRVRTEAGGRYEGLHDYLMRHVCLSKSHTIGALRIGRALHRFTLSERQPVREFLSTLHFSTAAQVARSLHTQDDLRYWREAVKGLGVNEIRPMSSRRVGSTRVKNLDVLIERRHRGRVEKLLRDCAIKPDEIARLFTLQPTLSSFAVLRRAVNEAIERWSEP